MVLRRFCMSLCMLLPLVCAVENMHARDFSDLNGTPYLQPLPDDSLNYAWKLYEQGLDCLEKGYPSLFFELSEGAERIFSRKKYRVISRQNVEILLRCLEIYVSENRLLIDKEEGNNLRADAVFNLLGTGVVLNQIYTVLEYGIEKSDTALSLYSGWFERGKARYLADRSLYDVKKGSLQEALDECEEALEVTRRYDTVRAAEVSCQKRVIQYLMRPFPNDARETVNGLKKLVSPAFTKETILRSGNMPLFYLYGVQIARIYEEQGNLGQALRTHRLLLGEIRKYLGPDFPCLLPEERSEIGLLLRYYLDIVQSFSLRHIRYRPVGELLFDHSLLKEGLLAIGPSPVSLTEKGRHPLVLALQDSIDSLYRSPDYYRLPADSCYFRRFRLLTDLMELKRKQVSVMKMMGPDGSVSAQPEDWKSLRRLLEPHEAVVKIVDLPLDVFDRQYAALVVTSDSSSPELVLLPRKRKLFRIGLGQQQAERIWEPVRRQLSHRTEIYLCLEGELVNWDWNDVSGPKKSSLDGYDMHRLLSIKDFVRLKSDKADKRNIMGRDLYEFGGAYFSWHLTSKGFRGQGVSYLPGSREELCCVDTMLPEEWKSHLFLGDEANKSNFLRLSSRVAPHSVIHIATHGFSLQHDGSIPDGRIVSFGEFPFIGSSAYRDPMMRNGFLLTGANRYWNKPVPYDAMDSGIVTAHDVSQMNLYGTDLVILSSCWSAAGDLMDGEGMYGLVRAFKVAGVRAVLANFHPVSDVKTVLFITTFYRHWIEGDSMFGAFCDTRRELMESYPEDKSLWSGFVLFE